MKSRLAGVAVLAPIAAAGLLWLNSRTNAQAPAQPAAASQTQLSVGLSKLLGNVCTVKYQDGDDSSMHSGVLKQVGEDWIVLDAVTLRRVEPVTSKSGNRSSRVIYTRESGQHWITTKSVITVDLDFGAVVR